MNGDMWEWINQVALGKETGFSLRDVSRTAEGGITGLSKGQKDHLVGIQVCQLVVIDEILIGLQCTSDDLWVCVSPTNF